MGDKPIQRKQWVRSDQSWIKHKADEDLHDSDEKGKTAASEDCRENIIIVLGNANVTKYYLIIVCSSYLH